MEKIERCGNGEGRAGGDGEGRDVAGYGKMDRVEMEKVKMERVEVQMERIERAER